MQKRQKVQNVMPIRSLFDKLPVEMVLTILSYNDMEDIQSTRGWQSKKVQHCTETRTKIEAAKNKNLDNLKWIHGYIGDIEFKSNSKDVFDMDGNRLPNSYTGKLIQ